MKTVKMRVVIDTNIIMAMLIKPGVPLGLFFKDWLELYAPDLLLIELERNKETLARKTGLDETEIEDMIELLYSNVLFVPAENLLKYRNQAEKICPDPKDIVYFATALYLGCPVWSNERGLKCQDAVKVYATHELISS